MKQAKRDSAGMRFLYHTIPGRLCLKLSTRRFVSKIGGRYLSSRLSRRRIRKFVSKNGIDLSGCVKDRFDSFNDFFTRELKPELRPIDRDPEALISPCDGLLSAYRIEDGLVVPVKQSRYSVASLLRNPDLAEKYKNGVLLVFRLSVTHYHRYCYLDDGEKGENTFLPGRLHTVRPIALEVYPVFVENCREYTVMQTAHFGTVTQVEVGAMMVGKIQNHMGAGKFSRGEEKGMFLFGGSTIVVLLEEGRAVLPEAYFEATARGEETPVLYGAGIGTAG